MKKQHFKSRSELAVELKLSRKTLYNRLKSNGIQLSRGYLSPEEQKILYRALGVSPNKEEKK